MDKNSSKSLSGFDCSRFTQKIDDQFKCFFCEGIVRNPQECAECGSLFCKQCIDTWLKHNPNDCVKGCKLQTNSIAPIGKALLRVYNNFELQCVNFKNCNTTLKMGELEKHESEGCVSKCWNYDVCKNLSMPEFAPDKLCSVECGIHFALLSKKDLKEQQLAMIRQLVKDNNIKFYPLAGQSEQVQLWDVDSASEGIQVLNQGKNCYLNEAAYKFRNIRGTLAMNAGCHYWEISIDERTKCALKIGIVTQKDIPTHCEFTNCPFGYGIYQKDIQNAGKYIGSVQVDQLITSTGVLGFYLNMDKGTLSVAFNGQFLGIILTRDEFKKGPIYPAVAINHEGGCSINGGLKVPANFENC